jgi:hypothetical protein
MPQDPGPRPTCRSAVLAAAIERGADRCGFYLGDSEHPGRSAGPPRRWWEARGVPTESATPNANAGPLRS